MQITPESIAAFLAALGVGGVLGQLVKNRGDAFTRRSDELTDFRKSIVSELSSQRASHLAEIAELKISNRREMDDLSRKSESFELALEKLSDELNGVRIDFAQFRAACRTMIMQMRKGDPSWMMIADVLSVADHDVDRIIISGQADAAAAHIKAKAAVAAEGIVAAAEQAAQHVVLDAEVAASSLRG